MLAGFVTLYYSDIINVLKVDPRVDVSYFRASVALTLIPVSVCCYLIIYLSMIKGIHSDDWEKSSPYAIPVATALSVIAAVLWNITLWGVYRFFTPIILLLLFMGFIMSISILPPWTTEKKVKAEHND